MKGNRGFMPAVVELLAWCHSAVAVPEQMFGGFYDRVCVQEHPSPFTFLASFKTNNLNEPQPFTGQLC